MQVFLIGYMGVGKSTLGKRLATRLKYEFCDLDQEIVKSQKLSITEIFAEKGEAEFRKMERDELLKLKKENIVIATGGGAPCFFDNLDIMKNRGVVVWLKLSEQSILNRLRNSKTSRPLIANLSENEILPFIKKQLNEREKFYEKAHFHVNVNDLNSKKINELAQTILAYTK